MKNGKHIEADLVILATGMNIQSNFPFSTIKVYQMLYIMGPLTSILNTLNINLFAQVSIY